MTLTPTNDVHVTYSEQAVQVVKDMYRQTAEVHAAWHRLQPDWVIMQAISLSRHLSELATYPSGASVSRDGDLSLYVVSHPLHFGVIFHARHYRVTMPQPDTIRLYGKAPYEGIYCLAPLEDGPRRVCAMPYSGNDGGAPTCEGHEPEPRVMPIPGEWSFHS